MKRLALSVFVLLSLGAAGLLAADFWEKKKFTEWSDKEAQKLLRDSPWARQVEVTMVPARMGGGGGRGGGRRGGGMGGGGFPDEGGGEGMRGGGDAVERPPSTMVTVRWHTALPVRQAVARLRFKDEAATSTEAAKMLQPESTRYVVGIVGVPMPLVRGNPETLKEKCCLRIKGQPDMIPADIQGERQQAFVNLYLFFARGQSGSHTIALEDNEVEVVVKLPSVDIKRKFKLKDMVYEGKLEI